MARPARFERAAFRLGGERSIRLSYEDIYSQQIYFILITLLCQEEIFFILVKYNLIRNAELGIKEYSQRGCREQTCLFRLELLNVILYSDFVYHRSSGVYHETVKTVPYELSAL